MTRRLAPSTLVLAALATAVPADPPAAPGTTAEVAFLGPDGPARVRFDVRIDGRPAEAAWREAADKLFAYCDRNGDGTLDAKEQATFARLTRAAKGDDSEPTPVRDARLDREGFAAMLRSAGLGPVRVVTVPARPDSRQLADALFARLDADGDGKLSLEELKAARDRLAALDADEDEYVSAQELLGRPAPQPGRVALRPPGRRPVVPEPDDADLLSLPADVDRAVKALLTARDRDKNGSLSREELGTGGKALAPLDKDGNGQLDPDELAAWLRQPADVEASLALGDAGTLTVTRPRPQEVRGPLTLAVPGATFRFTPPGGSREAWRRAGEAARRQFRQLAGAKGVLERKQLESLDDVNLLGPLFDFADRGGDGKLAEAEFEAALGVLTAVAGGRAEVTVADLGRGLFERLDANGDGRLSPRELLAAPALVRALDRDGDGALRRDELPRQFAVTTSAASLVPVQPPALPGDSPTAARAPSDVPEWFRRMDRNGDGDVSLREFLGPLELFRKLDRDGDGLLSPAEARAAK